MNIFHKSVVFGATVLALLLPATSAQAANLFYTGTGDWSVAGNWTGSTLPGSADTAIINSGSTVTVSGSDALSVGSFSMGSGTSSAATLDITGGSLTTGTLVYVGRNSNLSNAVLNLSGGTLTVASGGNLQIGNNSSPTAGSTAVATFSGGTYSGGLVIGNASSANQTGELIVQGVGAMIAGTSNESLRINATGTLDFVLGSTGVSLLNFSAETTAGSIAFVTGSTLSVNASSFTSYGTVGTIALISYLNSNSMTTFSDLSLAVTGVEAGYAGTIVNDSATDSIDLVITQVPEPSTASLIIIMGSGLGLLMVIRGRFRTGAAS